MDEKYNSRWTGEQIDEAVALARQGSIITGAEATTLAAGSEATAAVEGNVLKIGVPKGAAGAKGDKGYTPVKGTDYWTAADKQEMVNEVLAALPAAEGVGF